MATHSALIKNNKKAKKQSPKQNEKNTKKRSYPFEENPLQINNNNIINPPNSKKQKLEDTISNLYARNKLLLQQLLTLKQENRSLKIENNRWKFNYEKLSQQNKSYLNQLQNVQDFIININHNKNKVNIDDDNMETMDSERVCVEKSALTDNDNMEETKNMPSIKDNDLNGNMRRKEEKDNNLNEDYDNKEIEMDQVDINKKKIKMDIDREEWEEDDDYQSYGTINGINIHYARVTRRNTETRKHFGQIIQKKYNDLEKDSIIKNGKEIDRVILD